MKIDLTSKIIGVDGKQVNGESGPLVLAEVFKAAVLTVIESDAPGEGCPGDTPDQKLWKWNQAQLFEKNKNGSIEMELEDLVKIKERVHLVYPSPIIYGNVCAIIGEATK